MTVIEDQVRARLSRNERGFYAVTPVYEDEPSPSHLEILINSATG
jgi:hypothetical protein